MTAFVIRGARLVDPAGGTMEPAAVEVAIRDGVISEVGPDVDRAGAAEIDARGCILAPGFVDMHAHLREPGRDDEETISSGTAAAAAGGYTAVCAMPNTDPVADRGAVVEKVSAAGARAGMAHVVPAGALTEGLRGERMAAIGEMARSAARVTIFTDDGHGVQDALLARRLMEYIASFDGVYAEHCEVEPLARGGQMNEGALSLELGLQGVPVEAESLMAARDVALARMTGCRLHLLHVSTAETIEVVRRAKAEGVRVTAEAAPHHFALTESAVVGFDPLAKVNPPLRDESDRAAVIAALADGTIDAIATDHAPHATEEKEQEFAFAPPGMVGLETSLGLAITELVEPGHLSLGAAVERLSRVPARLLRLERHGGPVAPGRPANLVAFDPSHEWTVDRDRFVSRSSNSPFHGRKLRGRVAHVFYEGRATVGDGRVLEEVMA